jgi:GDP-L-fucose synthase
LQKTLVGTIEMINKRVVVTGGDGFLGHHVVPLLEREYSEVTVVKHEYYDLLKEQDVISMYRRIQPDVVIHLAARVGGIQYNQANPGKLFRENMQMGMLLIHEGMVYGRLNKFVNIGTTCMYPRTPEHLPFIEDDIYGNYPESTNAPYAISKRSLEVMGRAYHKQYGMNIIMLMPANMYGIEDTFTDEQGHVIPMLIKRFVKAKENKSSEVKVWGTGKATREFLYAGDCAEAIVLATEKYNSSEPMNIGSGQEIKIADLAKLIAKLVGFKGDIVFDTSMPDGQPRRFLDVSKAGKELGWKASTPLEEGLKKTIAWYLQNRGD